MTATRRLEPGILLAQVDIGLQNAAGALSLRRGYYDLREYMRGKLEKIDLEKNRAANCLFVHIPKCGGTSVENQIGIFHGHRSAVYFRAADPALFARAFKCTIVRNPYDRLVSGFHYLKHHTNAPLNHRWVERNLSRFDEFHQFAEALEEPALRRQVLAWKHFVPQWYFACDRTGAPMVDHVGKIEHFGAFLDELARQTPLRISNEVHRASVRRPWEEYYSERARRVVADMYREDFRIFGYPE